MGWTTLAHPIDIALFKEAYRVTRNVRTVGMEGEVGKAHEE